MKRIKIGDEASLTKRFTAEEVQRFSHLSLDRNPLHEDGQLAASSMFGRPVVHGLFVAALISAVLGGELPGPGTVYLSQELSFKAPVFFNDEVTARVEVLKIKPDKGIVTLASTCHKADGTMVIEGQAVVMNPHIRSLAG